MLFLIFLFILGVEILRILTPKNFTDEEIKEYNNWLANEIIQEDWDKKHGKK